MITLTMPISLNQIHILRINVSSVMHEGKKLGPNIKAEKLKVLSNLEKEAYPAFMMFVRFFFIMEYSLSE